MKSYETEVIQEDEATTVYEQWSPISAPAFLMGMCFPMGMQIARTFHPHLVPWDWGVNGEFSVFASILALVIALNLGLKDAILGGVLCYLVALAVIASLVPVLSEAMASADT
ncbi:MAG: hypothetical protein ACE5FP_01910 [Gemmatimonadota bacterium]